MENKFSSNFVNTSEILEYQNRTRLLYEKIKLKKLSL